MLEPAEGFEFLLEAAKSFGGREAWFNQFESDVAAGLLLLGFVDDAHAAFAKDANNSIGADGRRNGERLRRLEGPGRSIERENGMLEKRTELLLPIDSFLHFRQKPEIVSGSLKKEGRPFLRAKPEGGGHYGHDLCVVIKVVHGSAVRRSNSHLRARSQSRWRVRRGRLRAAAASVSVKPRKNFSSTTARWRRDSRANCSSSTSTAVTSSSGSG